MSSSLAPSCPEGWRDDDFNLFLPQIARCSLNTLAHYSLCWVWFCFFTFGLVDLTVSKLIDINKHPHTIMIPYALLLSGGIIVSLTVIINPYASVLANTSQLVLIEFSLGLILISIISMCTALMLQLNRGIAAVFEKGFDNSILASFSRKTILRSMAFFLVLVILNIVVTNFIMVLVFQGNQTTQQLCADVGGIITASLLFILMCLLLFYFSKIRSLAFQRLAFLSKLNQSPKELASSFARPEDEQEMRELADRLQVINLNTVINGFTSSLFLILSGTVQAIKGRYWLFHMMVGGFGAIGIVMAVTFINSKNSAFVTYVISPCLPQPKIKQVLPSRSPEMVETTTNANDI